MIDTTIKLDPSLRPRCDWCGCELESNFHGFNRDLCWSHYSRWLMQQIGADSKISVDCQAQLSLF